MTSLHTDLDLTDAVEAAARHHWEHRNPALAPWDDVVTANPGLAHDIREHVLPAVTAAAPVIAAAALARAHTALDELAHERDEARQQVADLRAGIGGLLREWQDVDPETWGVHPTGVSAAWAAKYAITTDLGKLLAGSGEQPGEDACEECEAIARMIYSDPSDLTGPCSRHSHDRPAPVVLDSPHGMWCPPGCGHDRSEAAVPDSEDVRASRIESGGEPAALMPTPPTVKPTLEQVVDVLAAQPPGRGEWTSSRIMQTARAVLALFPGRTEAEVYREGYDQGLRDAASVSRSEAEVKAEALRDAAQDVRLCWTGTTNLRDQDDPEKAYSFDRWLDVRAEHLANGGA